MHHIQFSHDIKHVKTAILIKESGLKHTEVLKYYIPEPIDKTECIGFSLKYNNGKITAKQAREYLTDNLLPSLNTLGITTLVVADSAYFKYLTGVKKADPYYGYVLDCILPGYEHMKVILTLNYQGLFYNPGNKDKIDMANKALLDHIYGSYEDPGKDIIVSEWYPEEYAEKTSALDTLSTYNRLSCDIETTDLRFDRGTIHTIAFGLNKHEGIAMSVEDDDYIKEHLREFFEMYEGELWFHNALFDVKYLIYHLFMKDSTDYVGMKRGLDVFAKVQDTMLYTYLSLNSTADVKLSLKANSQEYTGNYALDDESFKDVTKVPMGELLRYNLIDTLATWYVHDKYLPVLTAEDQLSVYNRIMQPSIKPLLEMMLVGLPIDLNRVAEVKRQLTIVRDDALRVLRRQKIIHDFEFDLQLEEQRKENAKLKKKIKSLSEFSHIRFNPNSNPQLQKLLYDVLKLPVIDYTTKKSPATGQKTLQKLVNHTDDPKVQEILNALIQLAQSGKILNDFIANFESLYFERKDGTTWLNGDQVLGGTQSGRLSARNPNLANLPANSKYGKLIKSCFVAPEGWLFGGADFSALEDKIGAILSKDEMKTKEFTQGFDGHSVRAIAFFSQLEEPVTIKNTFIDPEIVKTYNLNCVESVKKFKKEQEKIRQEAKAPSFALQYGGTYHTLHKNVGLPIEVAKAVEVGFHNLYWGSRIFAEQNAKFASEHGYVECAFGLRLRTPLMHQSILGSSTTPPEAESEARSANNAVTQSWGMLSNRAAIEIQERINKSPYKYDIFLVNQIHDAIYFIWRDDLHVTKWLNDNLIECMEWQKDPAIASDEIKLGAELDFGHSWDKLKTLNNKASIFEIQAVRNAMEKYTWNS